MSILSLMMPDDAGNASHALAHFLAMVVGAAIGGILFVRLDTLVNQHGGYLRKASITLAHIAVRHRADVRKQLQGVLDVSPFDSLPRERMKRLDQHLVTRLSRRARPTCKSGD